MLCGAQGAVGAEVDINIGINIGCWDCELSVPRVTIFLLVLIGCKEKITLFYATCCLSDPLTLTFLSCDNILGKSYDYKVTFNVKNVSFQGLKNLVWSKSKL